MDNTTFYYADNKTICVITSIATGQKFVGEASWDGTGEFSKTLGEEIASRRAYIEILRYLRESSRETEFAMNILLTDMKQSKKYNAKSYEAKKLRRALWEATDARKTFNEMIQEEKRALQFYIKVRCK